MPGQIRAGFWTVPVEELLSRLATSRDGLTQGEAQQRLVTTCPDCPRGGESPPASWPA